MAKKEKKTAKELLVEEAIQSPTRTVINNLVRNKLAIFGFVVFVSIFALVFIGSSLTPFDPYFNQPVLRNIKPGYGYMNFPKALEREGVQQIESGISYSVAVSKTGNVHTWGKDFSGVLTIPKDVQDLIDAEGVEQVASGDRHIVGFTKQGTFFGWGKNDFGQAGIEVLAPKDGAGSTVICPPTGCPASMTKDNKLLVVESEGIQKVGAGDIYSVILTKKGNVVAWGATLANQLDRIPSSWQDNVVDFKTTSMNIMVLLKNGTLDVAGARGSVQAEYMPKELKDGSVKVVDFAISFKNAAAVDEDGNFYLWGPKQYPAGRMPEIKQKVVSVEAGRDHFVAQLEDGSYITWGSNFYGETMIPDGVKDLAYFSTGYFQNYAVEENGNIITWGNNGFLLGSDDLGRDMFSRLLHGGRITLTIGAVAVIIQVIIGVIVGMIAGFYGGRIDNLLMRFAEIIGSFPFYPLVITISAMLPIDTTPMQRMIMVMVILGIIGWTGIARLVRGQILQEREKDFVLAARALGIKERGIILRHILPNVLNIVIVQMTLGYAGSLLTEAGLSFLGFGVPQPYPSWGNMLTDAQEMEVLANYWWRWIFPGFMVFITALSINLLGDGLRDALDPKSNEK